jgi:hypothetical protein
MIARTFILFSSSNSFSGSTISNVTSLLSFTDRGGKRIQGGFPFALSAERRGRPYRRRYSEMPRKNNDQHE